MPGSLKPLQNIKNSFLKPTEMGNLQMCSGYKALTLCWIIWNGEIYIMVLKRWVVWILLLGITPSSYEICFTMYHIHVLDTYIYQQYRSHTLIFHMFDLAGSHKPDTTWYKPHHLSRLRTGTRCTLDCGPHMCTWVHQRDRSDSDSVVWRQS